MLKQFLSLRSVESGVRLAVHTLALADLDLRFNGFKRMKKGSPFSGLADQPTNKDA